MLEAHQSNEPAELKPVLTPKEFFNYCGIGSRLGYELIRSGAIPSITLGKRKILIPRAAIERILGVA